MDFAERCNEKRAKFEETNNVKRALKIVRWESGCHGFDSRVVHDSVLLERTVLAAMEREG